MSVESFSYHRCHRCDFFTTSPSKYASLLRGRRSRFSTDVSTPSFGVLPPTPHTHSTNRRFMTSRRLSTRAPRGSSIWQFDAGGCSGVHSPSMPNDSPEILILRLRPRANPPHWMPRRPAAATDAMPSRATEWCLPASVLAGRAHTVVI